MSKQFRTITTWPGNLVQELCPMFVNSNWPGSWPRQVLKGLNISHNVAPIPTTDYLNQPGFEDEDPSYV